MTANLTTCPYCFQPKSDTPTTPSYRTTLGVDIDGEIKRTDDLISRLFIERSRLCRKRNEMQSPIYCLPPETLAIIFQFTCPPLDFLEKYGLDSKPPLSCGATSHEGATYHPRIIGVLSAVSAHWHHVVSSTPSLWTSFIVDGKDPHLMKTVFNRSGYLPASVSLEYPTHLDSDKQSFISSFLQGQASRIHMLHVGTVSDTWAEQNIRNFTNLKYLSLQRNNSPGVASMSLDSSCTHLVLKDFRCRFFLSWSKIEVLHLTGIRVEVCLELLEKCTQLVEYRFRIPHAYRFEEEIGLPTSPFTLPRLKLFEWEMDDEDMVDRAMLLHVRMPVLKTFVWGCSFIRLQPSRYISGFFERLPVTLSKVEIVAAAIHEGFSVFSYIRTLPNVERLVFRECTAVFMNDVFNNLGSRSNLVERQDVLVLPKLKSINIDRFIGYIEQDTVLETFRRYGSQRPGSLPDSPFRLELIEHWVRWTPWFKQELVGMVKQGCRVELWEDSKPVDWLPRCTGFVT